MNIYTQLVCILDTNKSKLIYISEVDIYIFTPIAKCIGDS